MCWILSVFFWLINYFIKLIGSKVYGRSGWCGGCVIFEKRGNLRDLLENVFMGKVVRIVLYKYFFLFFYLEYLRDNYCS